MTNVPDRRRIDTLGSLATLKNFPFRVQEKLGGEGRGLLSDHGPYEAADLCYTTAKSAPTGASGTALLALGTTWPMWSLSCSRASANKLQGSSTEALTWERGSLWLHIQ